MNYKMTVWITDPNTKPGMVSELLFKLDCQFAYDPKQYGNGHYVSIKGKDFSPLSYDLRYDHSFKRNEKAKWLEEWARLYWSGKNGAWVVKSLKVTQE